MKVFVVIATTNPSRIGNTIQTAKFPSFALRDDAWLVASDATTREVAERLGIRGGESGSGIVCSINGYSGRMPKDVWEWLALHEAQSE